MNDYEDLTPNGSWGGARRYGNVLTNGQLSFNGTAAMAKWRLQMILMADRVRCNDPRQNVIRTCEWPPEARVRLQ